MASRASGSDSTSKAACVFPSSSFINCLTILTLLLSTLSGVFLSAPVRAQADNANLELSFHTLGHGSRTVRGMWGGTDYFLPIPLGYMPVAGSELELIFSHSGLVHPELSTMTVLVNGEARADVALGPENAQRGAITIPLPHADENEEGRDYVAEGYFVQIQFYLRLSDKLCEAHNLPPQWAVIHSDSRYTLVTRARTSPPGLESVDRLLTPRTDRQYLPGLFIPQAPADDLLPALGHTAYYIGTLAASVGADAIITPTRTIAGLGQLADPAIVVASAADLPAGAVWGDIAWEGTTFTTTTGAASPQSLLAIQAGPTPRLLITGVNAEGVLTATKGLLESDRRALLQGSHQSIGGLTPASGPRAPGWRTGPITFGELGMVDARRISGQGQHYIDYYFERPPGWNLQPGSMLEIHLESAPNLRSHTSWIEATLNGISLGTYPLPAQPSTAGYTANPRRYAFTLPVDSLNHDWNSRAVRTLALQLRIFLDVPRSECEDFPQDSLWATVLPTSRWSLETQFAHEPDLGRFPWPFITPAQPHTETNESAVPTSINDAENDIDAPAETDNTLEQDVAEEDIAEENNAEENNAEGISDETEDDLDSSLENGVVPDTDSSQAATPLPTYVVLPADPTAGEIDAGLQIMAALGRFAGTGIIAAGTLPMLMTAAQINADELAARSLILIGSTQRNALIAEAAELAEAAVSPYFSAILSDNAAQDMPAASTLLLQQAGLLQIGPSPWNNAHMLLIVGDWSPVNESQTDDAQTSAGETDEGVTGVDETGAGEVNQPEIDSQSMSGLMVAARALATGAQVTQLRGDSALIVPDIPVQILRDTRTIAQLEELPPLTPGPTQPPQEAGAPAGVASELQPESDGESIPEPAPNEAALPESPLAAPGLPPSDLAAQSPPLTGDSSTATQTEMQRLGALAPWQVVGAVLLGMFIAVVTILFYARVRRKAPAL